MTKEQSTRLGQTIGFCLCGLMLYFIGWSLLRGLASFAPYLLTN